VINIGPIASRRSLRSVGTGPEASGQAIRYRTIKNMNVIFG